MSDGPSWLKPLTVAAGTTLVVALLARLPDNVSATAVGFGFLAATYWLVLRRDDSARIARYGLSFGGLFEAEPLSFARILRASSAALLGALAAALIFLPPFWLGFRWWWHVEVPFHAPPSSSLGSDFSGQLLVIALPEEAFYRGYLQSALDEAWKPRSLRPGCGGQACVQCGDKNDRGHARSGLCFCSLSPVNARKRQNGRKSVAGTARAGGGGRRKRRSRGRFGLQCAAIPGRARPRSRRRR